MAVAVDTASEVEEANSSGAVLEIFISLSVTSDGESASHRG